MKPNQSILTNFIFVFLYIIIAWFAVVAPYSKVTSLIQQAPDWIDSNLTANYPADLNISIKNGLVSLNQPSPYCLIIPSETAADQSPSGIIIDTNATADLSALGPNSKYSNLCQPYALVGKNFVLYPDSKNDNTFKYTEIPNTFNLDINRVTINNFVTQYLPMVVSFGQQAYFILPFVSILFLFLWLLSVNSWYAIVVYFAVKIFKLKPLSFGDSFKLSLFFYNMILFTEWVLINYVLNNLLSQEINLSFLFRNTILITIASIIYIIKTRPPQPTTTSHVIASDSAAISPLVTPVVPTPPVQPISSSIPTGQ